MINRIFMCEALSKRIEIDPFLKQMVTGDEKWVTYDNIVRKRSCSKRGEAAQTVTKHGLTAKKCQRLDHLKQTIDQKRPKLANRRGVAFHQDNAIRLARNSGSLIVRVQYFVRGGFVGYRSRASSKHLSPHLPVDELDSSGVKKGLRCRCKMHVWVSGPQRNRLDVDVFEK
ncbi:putative DD34D transposase [Trichonephila clavipes]|nr:putative DD34D transposase [Trichonephila clavipes]